EEADKFEGVLEVFNNFTDEEEEEFADLLDMTGEEAFGEVLGTWVVTNVVLTMDEVYTDYVNDPTNESADAFIEYYESLFDSEGFSDAKELVRKFMEDIDDVYDEALEFIAGEPENPGGEPGIPGGEPEAETFNVYYDANDGSDKGYTVSGVRGRYVLEDCMFEAKEGFCFNAWGIDGKYYDPGDVVYITEDTFIYAFWAPVENGFRPGRGESVAMPGGVTISDKDDRKEEVKEEVKEEEEEKLIILTIDEKDAHVFGNTVANDVAPVIRNSRTMLPIRFVVEALGGEVNWDSDLQKVIIVLNGTVIELIINESTAYVNGKAVNLDSPAFILDSRTYVPLRFVIENLGYEVIWNDALKQVTIKS
ncbi:MAG: copper amine oxidase N-terminal domain-containing protein, partial [Lachnospiraceae bacterium]|nr:copper amine oxidase N-terminal domain-containing protein [Lachnospiraceae bacterium]